MRDAFAERRFIVALFLSAWRVIRCNPLTRPGASDPVVRKARRAARPGSLRTISASMFLAGIVTMFVGGVAGAQSLTGPCTGTINGRHPATMTRTNPLVVVEGQSVTAAGTLQGATEETKSVTNIQVDIISGLLSKAESHPGEGPSWGGSVNVDSYLRLGKGLYRVHGNASAQGISCSGDGYVELQGASLIQAAAAGTAAVGAAGTLASRGRIPWGPVQDEEAGRAHRSIYSSQEYIDAQADIALELERERMGFPFSCFLIGTLALLMLALGMGGGGAPSGGAPTGGGDDAGAPGDGAGSGGSGGGAKPAPGTVLWTARMWKRGHTVWGFISGLLLGIGLTVVLQQASVWILDIWTAIVLPVGVAVLAAVRARIGRPYKIKAVVR